ncbi:hypothetical protein [Tistrella mobilis]|uniref:hypothetical protein n=1 Tax=Tistrella mobilis TaxID=171437 RepID=UPI003557A360
MPDTPALAPTDPLHRLARLLNDAAHDRALHQRLLADPRAALTAAGIAVDDDVRVTAEITPPAEAAAVVARTTPTWLILPVPPLAGDTALNDSDLDRVAGGGWFNDLISAIGPIAGSAIGKLMNGR